MEIQTILVPIDFSDVSKRAVNYAMILARKWGSKIIFVHGYSIGYVAYEGPAGTTMTYSLKPEQVTGEQRLQDFLNTFPHLQVLPYSNIIGLGLAVDVICRTAYENNVDLIVMGTKGASELEAFFIGTNSEKVSRKASCPILVIPEDLQSYEIDTVSLALDTNNVENSVTLDILVRLLKAFDAKLRIIHISENGDPAFKKHELLSHYKKSLEGVKHSFHVFYDENPHEGISEFLEKYPVDMLVLLYREHGFFERLFQLGTRKKIVFNTEIPLLILK